MTEQRLTQVTLDAIRARVEAATPGLWEIAYDDIGDYLIPTGIFTNGELNGEDVITTEYDDLIAEFHDLRFIAAAPTDIRALLAEVDVLRRERDEARARVQQERDYSAAVHDDYDRLFRSGMALVSTYEQSFSPVEDIVAAVDDLRMALDRTETGSEEEKAQEVAALREVLAALIPDEPDDYVPVWTYDRQCAYCKAPLTLVEHADMMDGLQYAVSWNCDHAPGCPVARARTLLQQAAATGAAVVEDQARVTYEMSCDPPGTDDAFDTE